MEEQIPEILDTCQDVFEEFNIVDMGVDNEDVVLKVRPKEEPKPMSEITKKIMKATADWD